jgi:hypothetical protein
MKTRWMVPLTAAAMFAMAIGAFGQNPTAPEQTPRPSPKSTLAPAAPTAGVAVFSDEIPAQPPQPPPPPPPEPPQAPKVLQTPRGVPMTTGMEPPQMRRQKSPLVNVRLEFTITDQTGTKPPARKTVMMLVADGESGRIRTNNEISIPLRPSFNRVSLPLSIDAAPEVEGNKIRLRVSLDLQSQDDPTIPDLPPGGSKLQQSVSAIVSDGVVTILSQSAEPVTDRKVTLEVKATILK